MQVLARRKVSIDERLKAASWKGRDSRPGASVWRRVGVSAVSCLAETPPTKRRIQDAGIGLELESEACDPASTLHPSNATRPNHIGNGSALLERKMRWYSTLLRDLPLTAYRRQS